jgi:hypothetical protein
LLKDAAKALNMNYSSAKTILRIWRLEKRICKKYNSERLKKRKLKIFKVFTPEMLKKDLTFGENTNLSNKIEGVGNVNLEIPESKKFKIYKAGEIICNPDGKCKIGVLETCANFSFSYPSGTGKITSEEFSQNIPKIDASIESNLEELQLTNRQFINDFNGITKKILFEYQHIYTNFLEIKNMQVLLKSYLQNVIFQTYTNQMNQNPLNSLLCKLFY